MASSCTMAITCRTCRGGPPRVAVAGRPGRSGRPATRLCLLSLLRPRNSRQIDTDRDWCGGRPCWGGCSAGRHLYKVQQRSTLSVAALRNLELHIAAGWDQTDRVHVIASRNRHPVSPRARRRGGAHLYCLSRVRRCIAPPSEEIPFNQGTCIQHTTRICTAGGIERSNAYARHMQRCSATIDNVGTQSS